MDKENEIEKERILKYLEEAYCGARACRDHRMQTRLSRAIIAFSYNDFFEDFTWEDMLNEYLMKF